MKRLLTVTYFVHFISENTSQHDRFERFWFWNCPGFIDWIRDNRCLIEDREKTKLVVSNCGKI